MLYLAQVHKSVTPPESGFKLLAKQESQDNWGLILQDRWVSSLQADTLTDTLLVLIDLNPDDQVESVQDAKPWILEIVQQYLSSGVTPAFLYQEKERVEQWRQSLTLQNQELDRRAIELEARREQIQALEEDLQRERLQLGSHVTSAE